MFLSTFNTAVPRREFQPSMLVTGSDQPTLNKSVVREEDSCTSSCRLLGNSVLRHRLPSVYSQKPGLDSPGLYQLCSTIVKLFPPLSDPQTGRQWPFCVSQCSSALVLSSRIRRQDTETTRAYKASHAFYLTYACVYYIYIYIYILCILYLYIHTAYI